MDILSAGTAHDAVHVTERTIDGYAQAVRVRLYRPQHSAALPIVLYFHGGKFTGGSIDDADGAARFIARHTPALVVSVGYSLAPRFPFPAAPEDAYATACWAVAQARLLGGNAARLAAAGDDAGGNLAASLALIARDRARFELASQVLIAPMLDPSMACLDTALAYGPGSGCGFSAQACALSYRQYLPKVTQRLHPYAAPIESARLVNLPPTLILTAQNDPLHIEAETYAAALIRAGVLTEVQRFSGVEPAALPRHAPTLSATTEFLQRHLS